MLWKVSEFLNFRWAPPHAELMVFIILWLYGACDRAGHGVGTPKWGMEWGHPWSRSPWPCYQLQPIKSPVSCSVLCSLHSVPSCPAHSNSLENMAEIRCALSLWLLVSVLCEISIPGFLQSNPHGGDYCIRRFNTSPLLTASFFIFALMGKTSHVVTMLPGVVEIHVQILEIKVALYAESIRIDLSQILCSLCL